MEEKDLRRRTTSDRSRSENRPGIKNRGSAEGRSQAPQSGARRRISDQGAGVRSGRKTGNRERETVQNIQKVQERRRKISDGRMSGAETKRRMPEESRSPNEKEREIWGLRSPS